MFWEQLKIEYTFKGFFRVVRKGLYPQPNIRLLNLTYIFTYLNILLTYLNFNDQNSKSVEIFNEFYYTHALLGIVT